VFQQRFVSMSPHQPLAIQVQAIYVHDLQYGPTKMHQISGPVAEDIQRTLWAEFTAKYLHLLVDRLLDLPPPGARAQQDGALDYPIQNIYHTTFKFTDIGYLAKFMLSSHTATKGASQIFSLEYFCA
jgi:hypothetical protein